MWNILSNIKQHFTDQACSDRTKAVMSHEQDVMIRAFDHVVRKNRVHGNKAAVVIGKAMTVLADINDFKIESFLTYKKNMLKNPFIVPQWIKNMFGRGIVNFGSHWHLCCSVQDSESRWGISHDFKLKNKGSFSHIFHSMNSCCYNVWLSVWTSRDKLYISKLCDLLLRFCSTCLVKFSRIMKMPYIRTLIWEQ